MKESTDCKAAQQDAKDIERRMQEQQEAWKLMEANLRDEIKQVEAKQAKQIEELKNQAQSAQDKRIKTKAKKARII